MFDRKTVWITGASSGIGEAVAEEFAADGAKVILSARREPELERVKAALVSSGAQEKDILVLALDVTDEDAMKIAVQQVIEHFGAIDFLFNNAGISQRSLCIDTEMATYRKLFEVDVFGQIALTKLVLPHMIARGEGHIAVTASVAGKAGVKQRTGYCAAKHAVMGFFDALRAEVTGDGIKVTTITPGWISTNISKVALKGDGSEFGKMDAHIAGGMDVNLCARKIMSGIKRGKPEILVGGGLERTSVYLRRFFPRLLFRIVAKMKLV